LIIQGTISLGNVRLIRTVTEEREAAKKKEEKVNRKYKNPRL
jgi:hypothetical protein